MRLATSVKSIKAIKSATGAFRHHRGYWAADVTGFTGRSPDEGGNKEE